jgi:hypothetical protein
MTRRQFDTDGEGAVDLTLLRVFSIQQHEGELAQRVGVSADVFEELVDLRNAFVLVTSIDPHRVGTDQHRLDERTLCQALVGSVQLLLGRRVAAGVGITSICISSADGDCASTLRNVCAR